ncbi:Bifunctional transcriptional activator/DNA repair enzyme AdaA [compost metagenome]
MASDKPIAEVGVSVGMSNTPYFITLFKKITGQTPASYRQMQNQPVVPSSEAALLRNMGKEEQPL